MFSFRFPDGGEKVIKAFKVFVCQKDGRLQDNLGPEIIRAMEAYAAAGRGAAAAHSAKNVGFQRLRRIAAIYENLPSHGTFRKGLVLNLIDRFAGTHRTTRSDYWNFLIGWEIIREVDADKFERGQLPAWIAEQAEGSK